MIFVTGGTGLVGAHLLVELAKKQQPIRALKRKTSNIKTVEKLFEEQNVSQYYQFVNWVDGDLLDVTELPNLLKGIDTIYHVAAFVSFDERQENEIFNTNILGTEALVNEAIDSDVKNFYFVSSIASMDDLNPVTKMIDERSSWNNSLTHSSYSISKFRAEMEVWRASQEGLKVIIINPGVIIGTLDKKSASESLFQQNSSKNDYATSGGTGFVDVRDVVKIFLELIDKELYNQKFIVVSENKTYREVLNLVATNNKHAVKNVSNTTLKIIKNLSVFSRIFGGKYITKANYNSLTSFTKYDNSKVKKVLQYDFIPIKESIDYHYKRFQKLNSIK
ncbi:NAD-dependent epimerase/dehydratase family protein [Empedobacter brevis]|uniref:NAD-dependent epimerase/dehydratase family protein n=1 Tax=Empedobacter brevis TaxID=247 RepID=UPI0039AEA501